MGSDGHAVEFQPEFVNEASVWQGGSQPLQRQALAVTPSRQRPSKTNSMASVPKDFLFVNKHSANLERDAAEAFNITSHVSRNHRKWLKNERQQRLKSSLGSPFSQESGAESTPRRQTPESRDDPTTSRLTAPGHSHGMLERCDPSLQRQGALSDIHAPARDATGCRDGTCRARKPLPTRFRHRLLAYEGNADPFAAAALRIGPAESEAISSASRFLVFAAWPETANSVFRTQLGDYSNSSIDLRDSIAHEAELHAVIAAGYSVKASSAPHAPDSVVRSFSHKLRSIELLRKQLQSGSLANTLTLVRLLISLDFNNGDFAAARVHHRGIRAMCQYDARTKANLRELLLISDVWTAMALLSKPDIDPGEYDPGALPKQTWYSRLTDEQAAELTRPSKNLVVMTLLGPSLHRLLQASEEVIHSKAIVNMEGEAVAISKTVLWMSRRGSATTGALMTQYAMEISRARGLSDTDETLTDSVRACTSLALILHMNFHWMDLPINYDFSKTFPAIEPILRWCSKSISSATPAIQQLFAWLCFLCAMGDDIFSARGDLDFSGWAALTFRNTCHDMKLHESRLAKPMLLGIGYEEDLMDDFLNVVLACSNPKPTEPLLTFSRWKRILNHYVAS